MPVKTRKTSGGYTNSTPNGVKGRNMTKKNAKRQKNLLNAVEHGWEPARDKLKRRVMSS
jgi:hypothetical protein